MIKWEHCRVIKTHGQDKKENGSIIELFKDGNKTQIYITVIKPGFFKGYHRHTSQVNKFICIKGEVYIHTRHPNNLVIRTSVLNSNILERYIVPPRTTIGVENKGKDDAWLLNFPDPPYDPADKEEMRTLTREEVEK